MSVMADQQQGAGVLTERTQQGFLCLWIQVIGRLIQQQDVVALHH